MSTAGLAGPGLSATILAVTVAIYLVGWLAGRRRHPVLLTSTRLAAFLAAIIILVLALVWPLPVWNQYLLAWRSVQKVLVAMVAPVLLWLACPWHVALYGLGRAARNRIVAARRSHGFGLRAARILTLPIVTWLLFVCLFATWHDPLLAAWSLEVGWAHYALPWFLLCAGLLFWFNVLHTAPRWRAAFPAWILIVYLVSMEALNLTTGITLAFTSVPIYPHYEAIRAAQPAAFAAGLSVLEDQMLAGVIVWVFGSFFYISSIIVVLHGLFASEGAHGPEAAPNWDSYENLIAPGLEHRVIENRLAGTDLSQI